MKKCSGACGGAVAYCNKDCQIKHWRQGHKKVCGKIATRNTFSILNASQNSEEPAVVPLRALHSLDGFGKSALCLYYSNHLGDAVSIPVAVQILGGFDPQDFEETMHCFMTSPIYDDVERELLKPGEACFNISKNLTEFNALVEQKIITPTDKTLQIGYYPTRHPVCRINLPLYKRGESG